ncbi:MAG: multiheme c-type cytochrome, partial [Planctomycetota bacterium]
MSTKACLHGARAAVRGPWRAGARKAVLLAFVAAMLALARPGPRAFASSTEDAKFIGQKKCRMCHFKLYKKWRKTQHAVSWKKVPEKDRARPECVRCHATGYGRPGGFVSEEKTPHLTGVQCESCHGPGGAHARAVKEDKPEKVFNSLIKKVALNLCMGCHKTHKSHEEYEKGDKPSAAPAGAAEEAPQARPEKSGEPTEKGGKPSAGPATTKPAPGRGPREGPAETAPPRDGGEPAKESGKLPAPADAEPAAKKSSRGGAAG